MVCKLQRDLILLILKLWSFPSPSCYWINLKWRCLFVKLLFLQNTSKCSCFSILWAYFWNYCYLFCTLQNKHGRETSNSLQKLWFEWDGRQNMHWSKGTKVMLLDIWGVEDWPLFRSCHLFCTSAKILYAPKGGVEGQSGRVRLSHCENMQLHLGSAAEMFKNQESHIWALNTLINVSRWFKGKDGNIIFFLENFSFALWALEYFYLLFGIINLCFSVTFDAKPFTYLNI